jgi:ribA/ribD-fused uncharacterized protein
MINTFRGPYYFLSNFTNSLITYKGITYPTVEHAYQAQKTVVMEYQKQIAKLDSPGKAKRQGRNFDIRPDWEEIKLSVMEELLWLKFSDTNLKNKLLGTKNYELQEGNYWGDRYWGIDLKTGKGRNELGKLLMKIRRKIVEESNGNNKHEIQCEP